MSLDKDAIIHVQKSASVLDQQKILDSAGAKEKLVLVPEGMTLKNLSDHMENAAFYEAHFATPSVPDFVEYAQKYSDDDSQCFVDPERMSAKAYFDIGNTEAAGHKKHTSALKLVRTAPYSALLGATGTRLSQKEASEFIEDWYDFVKVLETADGNESVMNTALAAQSLRDITIETVKSLSSKHEDFGAEMSQQEKIAARNKDKLPAKFLFTCKPFTGLGLREFEVRISLIAGGSAPEIVFRIVQLEKQQEDMAEEFKEILVDSFEKEGPKTYIGQL